MSAYQPGIPTGTVPLNEDYINLQNNFQQLDTSFGVDHVKFSVAANFGYHTDVHLIPVSTIATNPVDGNYPISHGTTPPSEPDATPGFGQVFCAQSSDGLDTDEILYYLSGGDKLVQLTRNFVPLIASNGYTFVSGGLMIQWGFVSVPVSATAIVNFATANKNFPANCFAVFTTITDNSASPSVPGTVSVSLVTPTSFKYTANYSTSTKYNGFYWLAIGN